MFYQIKSYISFLFRSKKRHGIHSSFVFNLISNCFYKKNKDQIKTLEGYRETLLKDTNTINVSDFGAGSRVFKSNTRRVKDIVKNAGITTKKANVLINLVSYLQPKNILEIGTSLGLGTLSLYLGNKEASIKTLEGCPETLDVAKKYLKSYNSKNIQFVQGDFKDTLHQSLKEKFDLIYFDGNHQKDSTIAYFEEALQSKHNDSLFIFDDIYWSKPMQEAWEYIKAHNEVTITIDSFYWGLVFFRKEQKKEHFTIRI